jgi:hypothetical protein
MAILPRAASRIRALPDTHEITAAKPLEMPGLQLFSDALHMPFDVMRSQHAQAVHAGLMANSILESRDFENRIDALEHICLGPFARHV